MQINKYTSFSQCLLVGMLILSIAACSSTSSLSSSVPSDTQTANIFSDLKELDYVSTSEQARITAGDMLDIKVFQAEELTGKVRVESSGNISLPLLGSVKVAGLTPSEVETKLKNLLGSKYLQNPQVTVFMEDGFTTQRVTLEGEVKKPGVYPIKGSATVLQAIAMGEGLAPLADSTKIVLFRRSGEQTKAYNLNLDAIRNGKVRDPYVRGDDLIVVHRSDSRYWMRETAALLSPFSALNSILK